IAGLGRSKNGWEEEETRVAIDHGVDKEEVQQACNDDGVLKEEARIVLGLDKEKNFGGGGVLQVASHQRIEDVMHVEYNNGVGGVSGSALKR
ncbi:hypothetical protein L195_g062059, partial [Trifolium pratense]